MKKIMVGVAAAIIAASASFAERGNPSEWYIAGSIGQAEYDLSLSDFADIDDGSIISASLDDSDTSYSLYGGFRINQYFAVEGGYLDLGESALSAQSDGSELYFAGPLNLVAEVDGFNIGGKGIIPINEKFELFAKLGVYMWEAEAKIKNGPVSESDDDDGSDAYYALGGTFLVGQISINAEYALYELEDVDVENISVGLQYAF
tara:strand:+ start:759 stop:1370 length:612 start_codon:yes stop_codon:yes gene_type:complete